MLCRVLSKVTALSLLELLNDEVIRCMIIDDRNVADASGLFSSFFFFLSPFLSGLSINYIRRMCTLLVQVSFHTQCLDFG